MPGRSQLNKIILLLSVFLISCQCLSAENTDGIYDKYHSNDELHGLFEINEVAKTFVTHENLQNGTRYTVIGPNLKTLVPICAVPLKAIWTPKDRGLTGKNVSVICTKTKDMNYPKWDVLVPVSAPK